MARDPSGLKEVFISVIDGVSDELPEVTVIVWYEGAISEHAVEKIDDGLIVNEHPGGRDCGERNVRESSQLGAVRVLMVAVKRGMLVPRVVGCVEDRPPGA